MLQSFVFPVLSGALSGLIVVFMVNAWTGQFDKGGTKKQIATMGEQISSLRDDLHDIQVAVNKFAANLAAVTGVWDGVSYRDRNKER